MNRIFSLCLLLGIFASAALADVRLPNTPKPTPAPKEKKALETRLFISIQKNEKEARLQIPKDQIKQLRAQLDELDGGSNNAAFLSFSRTQTVVSGLFLSLAFVFGGVWLARSRQTALKPNKSLVAGAVLFFSGALAAVCYANIGPPIDARSITSKIFSQSVHQYKQASGKIKLEINENDDNIRLIVPDMPDDRKTDE